MWVTAVAALNFAADQSVVLFKPLILSSDKVKRLGIPSSHLIIALFVN